MDTAVVWFRRDLRLHDNETLVRALADADEVVPLYVFDPDEYADSRYVEEPKTGPYRARFVRESVADLRANLRARGGDLLVRHGDPREVVPAVASEYDADAAYAQTMPATEELTVENGTKAALAEDGVPLERFWTHTLYHVNDLPTPVDDIADTYTPWRKEVENGAEVRETFETPPSVPTPEFDPGDLPSLDDLGIEGRDVDDRAAIDFRGGESAGRERLQAYVWEADRLRRYKETRNGLLGPDFSSKLSAWLSQGCLSPRYVSEEVDRYEAERVANDSTYWLVFELLWRDFFQFQFIKHGGDFFGEQGIRGSAAGKEWRRDGAAFERWAAGETGVPFVDANMRELNETGYMSNRGRQNVASFLADVLGIDWRRGAAYFESRLTDYDVCSNWGNWAYQAGVGNDSRDNYFNVLSQAERYDSNAEYVTHWLPELDGLPPEFAHRPWRMDEGTQAEYGVQLGLDYPAPMLDVEEWYRMH
ncbi:DASH family cryptochrome [Halosegnis marinus]|uniref:Cryptochrome DASH n=1 Tax=Halosegnis marinus TaxID=3034023 RepID=A0ABD5ZSF8_9EURY|nr:DASH family cryptochrome [Halosegnis sp. DT85]